MSFAELIRLSQEREAEFWEQCQPGVSIDCVVFGFHRSSLRVLLLKLKGSQQWALPGGYLYKNEELDQGAYRILKERTSVEQLFLEQFKVFGGLRRSEAFFREFPEGSWFRQRFISIGYYALINYEDVYPTADIFSEVCEWVAVEELPDLMMDHAAIYGEALKRLRWDLNNKPIGSNLLPEKFTMPELQRLYEIVLGKELNRGNFYRKIRRYGILEKLDEQRRGGAHKAPDLYRFNMEKYTELLELGMLEGW